LIRSILEYIVVAVSLNQLQVARIFFVIDILSINADFVLIADRLLVKVDEFYWVFDSDDMTVAVFVAMIN
jgi:hypothetical protein